MVESAVVFVPVFAFNNHLQNTNQILKIPDSSRKHSYKRHWCPFSSLVSSYFWCKGQLRVTICMLAAIFTLWLTFSPSFNLHLSLLSGEEIFGHALARHVLSGCAILPCSSRVLKWILPNIRVNAALLFASGRSSSKEIGQYLMLGHPKIH